MGERLFSTRRSLHCFSQAGFTISERLDAGREHAPNRQKLICFRDGSYIEILTVQEPDARLKHRLHKIGQHGDGWADFCLEIENAEIEMVRVCAANLPVKGPTTHSKFLENGKEWGVKLLNTGIGIGHPVLPFMVEDTVGRNLRIPQSGLDHANGAVGIGGVRLAVDDLDLAVDHMSRLLNLTAILTPAWDEPHAGQRFKLRSGHWIDLFLLLQGHRNCGQYLKSEVKASSRWYYWARKRAHFTLSKCKIWTPRDCRVIIILLIQIRLTLSQ